MAHRKAIVSHHRCFDGTHAHRAYRLDDLHFYCDAADLTRPFPSLVPPTQYDEEFCFNTWLASPFVAAGLVDVCCVLVQGVATSKAFSLGQQEGMRCSERYRGVSTTEGVLNLNER